MNEQQLLAAYEREALHQYRAESAAYINEVSKEPCIDWALLHQLIPWLAAAFAWLMWAVFLLVPTLFNFDYAGMFPAVSNYAYVMMGLTLCLAASVAAKFAHGVRAIAFTFSVLLLSYWIF